MDPYRQSAKPSKPNDDDDDDDGRSAVQSTESRLFKFLTQLEPGKKFSLAILKLHPNDPHGEAHGQVGNAFDASRIGLVRRNIIYGASLLAMQQK